MEVASSAIDRGADCLEAMVSGAPPLFATFMMLPASALRSPMFDQYTLVSSSATTPGPESPLARVTTSHPPLMQAFLQLRSQAPQWAMSRVRSTSQPSAGSPLQSAKPASQTRMHAPAEQ